MMNKRKLALGLALSVGLAGTAWAAGFITNGLPPAGGTQYPSTLPLTGAEQMPADTQLAGGLNPASEAITIGQLTAATADPTPRNYLDNGAMVINQQGTGTITGGTTSITALQFAADRWFIDTNVGSGAGQAAVITASPAPPAGFTQSFKLWRNSGALTQPVCTIQAIETVRATQLAGKYVVLSAYVDALAGLTATGGLVNAYVITGTGTDQGIATLTASPAITPAWTGIAASNAAGSSTAISPAGQWAATTSWNRFNTVPVLIPTTATEVGVEICFTPVGSSSGATDGIALTGVQLEPVLYSVAAAAPPGASTFEFRTYQDELLKAQRFFWQLNEPASGAGAPGFGQATGATAGALTVNLPTQFRGTTPVVAIPTTGTFKVNIAGTPTTWVTPTAGTCGLLACTITIGNTNTAGQALQWTGGGGSGVVYVKSDVVM